MPKDRKIVFRRIKGRIIPIRIKDAAKDIVAPAVAGTTIAAATGVAVSSLYGAPSKLQKFFLSKSNVYKFQAALLRKRAPVVIKKQMVLPTLSLPIHKGRSRAMGRLAAKKLNQLSVKYGKWAGKASHLNLEKFAIPLFFGGAAVGGFLIGKSILNSMKDKKKKPEDPNTIKGFGVGQIGQAAGFTIAGTAFLRHQGVKPFSKALKESVNVLRLYKRF